MTQDASFVCQVEGDETYSTARRPTFIYGPSGARRWLNRGSALITAVERAFRQHGLLYTIKKSATVSIAKLQARFSKVAPPQPKELANDEVALHLQPGDWVEVKTLKEILESLDANGKYKGLAFTREMQEYCGRRYRVFKRLDFLFNEYTREQRKVKNTVLLEGVYCRGSGFGCDRSCFHFWREAWLRRVPAESPDASHTG